MRPIPENILRVGLQATTFTFRNLSFMLVLTGLNDLHQYELKKLNEKESDLKFTNLSNFFGSGRSIHSNTSAIDFSNVKIASAMSEPAVTIAKSQGGVNGSVYDRSSSVGWLGLLTDTGMKINLIKVMHTGSIFQIQLNLSLKWNQFSIFVKSADELKLFSVTDTNEIASLNYSSGAVQRSILFTNPFSASNHICALSESELVFYNPNSRRLDVYSTAGGFLRSYGSNINAVFSLSRSEIGCQVHYTSNFVQYFSIIYPSWHSKYTPALFISLVNPFNSSMLPSYQYIRDGLAYIFNADGRMALLTYLQPVANFSGIFVNTKETVVQNFTYTANLGFPYSSHQHHTPLFTDSNSTDRFFVASISNNGTVPSKLTAVYSTPLSITCKNPTFQGKEESREFYFKVGVVMNPDAIREKNLMYIIRKKGLTREFNEVLKNPIIWIGVVFTVVAIVSTVLIVFFAAKKLKKINAISQAQGGQISYSEVPNQARREGKFGSHIQV